MACDTQFTSPAQTITERKEEIRTTVAKLAADLAAGRVKVVIDKITGAVAFDGFTERKGITDACAYRRVMATGNALAKAKISAAEALCGRSVNRQAVAAGHHSHDGGKTWHHGH